MRLEALHWEEKKGRQGRQVVYLLVALDSQQPKFTIKQWRTTQLFSVSTTSVATGDVVYNKGVAVPRLSLSLHMYVSCSIAVNKNDLCQQWQLIKAHD